MLCYTRAVAFIVLSSACFAQTKAPAALSPATPNSAPQALPVLRTSAQLVVVDVVVTDHSGKPVHGLTASDFAVSENGAPQKLLSFEEHSTLAPAATPQPLPPGVFTNTPSVPPGGAVTILLLDSLNTPLSDQSYLHQQLMAYLKSATPGSRIAIFGLSDHLLLLQGFDSDPAVLRKAMEKINVKASTVRSDVAGDGIQNSAADTFEDMGTDPAIALLVANLRQWDAQQQSLELQTRAKYTIDAFNQLALSLAAIPGRKNLIWFSASFPLDVPPDTTDNQGSNPNTPANDNFLSAYAGESDVAEEFHQALDRLSRSQVAVYPIDVRGVTLSAVYSADTTRNYGGGSRGAARFTSDQNQFINNTVAENSTMTSLASATGGHAYISTNDLTQAVKEAIDQGSNFYSLSYAPTDSATDGKLRHIKVQVSHPGVTLAYRQSYYAVPPDAIKTDGLITQVSASLPATDPTIVALRKNLRLAMTRGAPVPTDILFRVGVVPMSSANSSEEAVAQHNMPTEKGKGPWRRYSVNYQIDPAGLVFTRAPDGKIHSDFDLLVYVFTPQGERVNVVRDARSFIGSDAQVRDFFQHGIVQHIEVSVPAKGEYFLRIAVHDLHRDHYGAVEVATSQVSKLVPIDAAAGAPATTATPK